MIYRGPHSGTHYGGKPAGSRYYLSVIGLAYDEETNTFAAATQVTLSDVFEITQEALPVDKPWVEMSDPTYADGKITLIITRNEAAGDYLFGGAFAPNYRDTHSDSDIISELAGTEESMKKYLIPEWHNPIVLTGEVAPGEKKLFVATGEKENILRNMQLNWMILQAPYEAGGEVRILDSYAGIQQPEYPAPENPDPADITFEASAQVDGTSVSYTITPSDPDVYYFTYIRPAADVATPEAEQEAAQNLIDTFNNYMRTTYDTVEQYMAAQGNLFKGATTQTEEGFDAGEYCVIYIAAEITITPGTPYDTIEATQIGTLGKTAFTIEKPTSDIPFTTSVQVTGGTATLTITPTDPNAYYVLAFDVASEFATPEGEADMLDWKFTYVVNPLDNQYYDYTGTKQYDIAGYMSSHNDLFQGPTTYTAEAEPGDYCFYFFIIEFDHPNWTVNLSSPLYKVPFTIE